MSDELTRLKKEKAELERRIELLTSGTITLDHVKLDYIKTSGVQNGKWAVYYKYFCTVRRGRSGRLENWEKWVPLFNCDTREQAIETIPEVLKNLSKLYKEAMNGTDS